MDSEKEGTRTKSAWEPKTPPMMQPMEEVPPPMGHFPKLEDWGKELKEILEKDFFPEEFKGKTIAEEIPAKETAAERRKTYRIKSSPTIKRPVAPKVTFEEVAAKAQSSSQGGSSVYSPEWLSLSSSGIVQGIIMSEILQPPRSKRPMRQEIYWK